ncbi:MAG: carbohydrate ABC transporter permease [Victivallaceae bacterium]|nr:carbohydrate ABC transporter permease [Victivallaceae bacterium]
MNIRHSNWWRAVQLLLRFFIVTFISAVMFVPFLWMLCSAFKGPGEIEGMSFWPEVFHPKNLLIVLRLCQDPFSEQYLQVQLLRYILNSIFVASWVTVLQVTTSSMAAYAFSRIVWPGRNQVFLLYLATMMIPGLVLTIPVFQIMVSLNLVNSFTGLILPGACSAFGTFMLRQFMLGIPLSYDEAARIDGAGHFQIFTEIILPQAKPGIITLAIFTFLSSYRNLMWPLIMVKSDCLRTVPIGLLSFMGDKGGRVELLLAATVICIIPLILIFVICQKKLISGINLGGGVKG